MAQTLLSSDHGNIAFTLVYHWYLKKTEELKTFRWKESKILLMLLWCIFKCIYWISHFKTILNASVWGLIYDYLATSNLRGHMFISFKEVIIRIKITTEVPISYRNNLITLTALKINKWKNSINSEKKVVIPWIEFTYK